MNILCAPVKLPLNEALPRLQASGLDRIKLDAKKPRRLRRGQVISFDLSKAESWKITLRSGQVWITMEGDPTDHVLNSGEVRHFQNPGRLVVEALVESEFFCGKI